MTARVPNCEGIESGWGTGRGPKVQSFVDEALSVVVGPVVAIRRYRYRNFQSCGLFADVIGKAMFLLL